MVNEAEIAKWVRSLSENERLILATYEGNNCMPEIMERYWNARALESLILQGIIEWTIPGYKLSEDGVLLAQYIDNLEKTANRFTGTTGNNSINDSAKKKSRKRMKFGEPCPKCGAEVVKITRDTLNKIKTLTTKFHSVSKSRIAGKQAYIPICPECDAYALGIEFETGFPFILKNGQESEIQQIADMLWQPDKPFRSKNLENIKSDSEADVARNSSIIPFPRYSVPTIDWDEIERIRVERYPELPPEIIEVLKPLMASTPASSDRYSFQINSDSDEMYPPDPIPLIPGKACAICPLPHN